ncbi:TRAP transporter large permease [Alkalihalobacillus oceani]|uniref:TRAP transporter large permease n=1 Tax=Halalkalibacter oceani TaxID=1653776 RepID=UPI00203D7522|nr:TRAP transporter large permease [Halalkalibacter oceani]MCM3762868.1 TRAP transporter large permease [Halalkalibacter oceani]
MTFLLLFGTFILFLLLSVPIGIALGLSSVVTILGTNIIGMDTFTQRMIEGLNNFPLLAVPLFAFAGDIMGRGGIAKRLLNLANIFFGRITGGLGVVTVIACLFFAAISGTGSATVAAIGLIMIPAMIAKGYAPPFATALVATSGTVGTLIPPSVTMIIYAVTAGVSVTQMFAAGIGPGLLVGIALITFTLYYANKHKYKGEENQYTVKEAFVIFLKAIPALLVPVIVLGGIYGGIFTPTEAAGAACIYGIILSVFVYKEIKITELPYFAFNACMLSAAVLLIIGMSAGFGLILTVTQLPVTISSFIIDIGTNMIVILLLINVLLLITGTFMETNAAIVILTPILLPIVTAVGVDPVHFGLIMVLNLAIGFITPPLGANLFMATKVSNVSYETLAKSIIPWIFVMIVVLLLVTFIPSISLYLPSILR